MQTYMVIQSVSPTFSLFHCVACFMSLLLFSLTEFATEKGGQKYLFFYLNVEVNIHFNQLTHLAPDQPLPFCYEIPCEGK